MMAPCRSAFAALALLMLATPGRTQAIAEDAPILRLDCGGIGLEESERMRAEVGMHALTDAIYGALADGDIGRHFPPSDPQWKGASSDRFLIHAVSLAAKAGYRIGNVDLTLICEAPKIGPHRQAMRERLAGLLGCAQDMVSVKATTTEKLGFAGRSEGIAAQAAATLLRD